MPARFKEKDGVRIYPDGREVCYTQKAWDRRRGEVFERDGWKCQCGGECGMHQGRICGHAIGLHAGGISAGDAHHKISRGSGGSRRRDNLDNLQSFCRPCHLHVTERERFKGIRGVTD